MYLIVDTAIYERNRQASRRRGSRRRSPTWSGRRPAPGSLQLTVGLYNRHAAEGVDPLFHKNARWLQPLMEPPFAAIDCSTDKVLWATFTLGGLHTVPGGEVLRRDDQVIPGLFAAGRTTKGVAATATRAACRSPTGVLRAAGRAHAARAHGPFVG